MKTGKSIVLLLSTIIFLSGCMMTPWGMNGTGGMAGMHGGNIQSSSDYEFNRINMEGNFSLNLNGIISESNGNSKFIIKLENLDTGEAVIDYESEMNLYYVPYVGAPLRETLNNPVVEGLPFSNNRGSEKYLSYTYLTPGEYFIIIKITSVNGTILNTPLSFEYSITNSMMKSEMNETGFIGVNYWVWGAVMTLVMGVMMLGVYF